jgi:hypothetical protein
MAVWRGRALQGRRAVAMIAYLVGDRGGELGPERGVAGPARLPGRPPPAPQQVHL